jgi:plastocyanin
MKTLLAAAASRFALVVASLALTALLAFAGTQALASTTRVKVGDNYFVHKGKPSTVSVRRGSRLTWRFVGASMHNVTVTSGPQRFRSGNRKRGTFSHTFAKAGTYKIVCTIHANMRMTVRVH